MKRLAIRVIVVLAVLGLIDSVYILTHEVSGTPLICEVVTGCNTVANSPYASIFGVPIAAYGVVFYFMLIFIALLEILRPRLFLRRILQSISVFGMIFSLYFLYLQVVVIKALCIYCLWSLVIDAAVFIAALFIETFFWSSEIKEIVEEKSLAGLHS